MMKKSRFRSVLLPLIVIPVGGVLVLAVCFFLYYGVYLFIENVAFLNDPSAMPAGTVRNFYALALVVLLPVLMRTRLPDLLKAIILFGPLATLIIAGILRFYQIPALAIAITVAIAACSVFLVYRYRKPWFFYYAIALTVLAGIAYAWPGA
jgi:hypothetical protein